MFLLRQVSLIHIRQDDPRHCSNKAPAVKLHHRQVQQPAYLHRQKFFTGVTTLLCA